MPDVIGTWRMNANGHEMELRITGLDTEGNLSGTIGGNNIIGFWHEPSQKLTLMRLPPSSEPGSIQVYTGYLFRNQVFTTITFTLAGSFEAFADSGGTSSRSIYGWFARRDEPIGFPA